MKPRQKAKGKKNVKSQDPNKGRGKFKKDKEFLTSREDLFFSDEEDKETAQTNSEPARRAKSLVAKQRSQPNKEKKLTKKVCRTVY